MGRYRWSADAPPLIDEHSSAKHHVLRRYVENYIQILCLNPRRERLRLAVVDGFCGGGIYHDTNGSAHPGSPIVLLDALRNGRAFVRNRRNELGMKQSFELDATLHLNDNDPDAIRVLNSQLALQHKDTWTPKIDVTCLDFEAAAYRLIHGYRSDRRPPRILFVLDQYGFTDATLPVMKALFDNFPKAEIVLTFAVDSLVNFASQDTIDLYRKCLAKAGFDQSINAEQLAKLKAEDDGARHLIQTLLLREVFPQTGATFATPFFIVPRQSRRAYWLVHLANNARANDEMKCLHWETQNHFMHYGPDGIGILAFDPLRLDESPQHNFDFGDFSKERALSALRTDLPKLINDQNPTGTTVGQLLEDVANNTPANREMIRQVLFDLSRDGDLEITTATGRSRKNVNCLDLDDEVRRRRQFFLFR